MSDGGVILVTNKWQDDTTRLYYAANGLDFSQVLQFAGQDRIARLAFSGTSWSAIGPAGIYRAEPPFGVWTLTQAVSGASVAGIAFGSGLFIAFYGSTQYKSDDDGATWVASSVLGQGVSLTYTGANWIRRDTASTIRISTDDGASWSASITPLPLAEQITGIASNGSGKCIVVGNKFSPTVGYIGYSDDHGATWNVVDTVSGVAFYGGGTSDGAGFVAVGKDGSANTYGKYSLDGGSWSVSAGLGSVSSNSGWALGYSHAQSKYLASWGVYNGVDDTISYVRAESTTGASWSAWSGTSGIRDVVGIYGGYQALAGGFWKNFRRCVEI